MGSLFWLLFSIIFCIGAINLSLGSIHKPGPGLFPFLSGAVLALLSFIDLLAVLRRKWRISGESESPKEPVKWRNIILTLAVLFAFPWLLDLIGLAPALFVFFVVLLRFVEPQSWPVILGGSAGGAVIVSLVFQGWLKIQFPIGIFGI